MMSKLARLIGLALLVPLAGLPVWRWRDARSADAAWARLSAGAPSLEGRFDPTTIAMLPEPAQQFFRFAIAPGTPLRSVAEIEMSGTLSLGTKEAPGYQPMRARQILAARAGLVWKLEAGRGLMRVAGSDGLEGEQSWTRFWLLGLVPIVREGGSLDHLRAAFGRAAAEAAFWTPAALLPQAGATWEAVDADTARATLRRRDLTQTVDIRVDAEGRPLYVSIPRWTNANPDREYRLQPFGGTLSDFREVGGYRVPFRVEGGNFFGTDDYFPFYRAEVEAIRFLPSGPER
jgi:hypothetical protein